MKLSVNELESLATKAARGAGAYPAQAAHFGRAAAYHLAALRAASELQDALAALPSGPIQTRPITLGLGTALDASYDAALTPPDMRPPLPSRLICPAALYDHMHMLAQNTYVPATAASRTSGAGAGLTDND